MSTHIAVSSQESPNPCSPNGTWTYPREGWFCGRIVRQERNMRNLTGMFFVFAALFLEGATDYKVEARYSIPGTGGFDYVTLDSSTRRLYISHATQVDV